MKGTQSAQAQEASAPAGRPTVNPGSRKKGPRMGQVLGREMGMQGDRLRWTGPGSKRQAPAEPRRPGLSSE